MKQDQVCVADDLTLDADDIAGGSLAVLGMRGAGKSFTARVLAEELFAAHVQVVIIDPMGVFWGLRSSMDGTADGLPIPVFGGTHGDAPLESSAGALMADLAVGEGLSMVLDMSAFGSRTQERAFASAFFDRLYRRNHELVHVIVDEADLFAPQKPRGEDAKLLVTMENLVRRGRNRGIGVTLASQRAAVVNKDVLTQVDGLVAMRVIAPQDRDAIRDWVQGQGDSVHWGQIAPSLPSLADGESWWWIPARKVLQRVQVRHTRTFDSSRTRRRGQSSRVPKTQADIDLSVISDRMAATIERAKAQDPRELGRRIAELEAELARRAAAPVAHVDAEVRERVEAAVAEVAVLGKRLATILEQVVELPELISDQVQRLVDPVLQAASSGVDDVAAATSQIRETAAAVKSSAAEAGEVAIDDRRSGLRPPVQEGVKTGARLASLDSGTGSIAPARQRIIDALAELAGIGIEPADKTQLALWAGVSPKSSGYANNLGGLRSLGLLDYPAPSRVALTEAGRGVARGSAGAITSTVELHRKIESLVSPARWRILAPLVRAYPGTLSREAVADAAGVSASSSGYANNLGALRSLGLIDYPDRGCVRASAVMFLQ
ncbi:ATP-binding protein [Mycobacterium sp. 134]|uniref:ATP-binding protein n=1 Tax=Mycobacterium sp. 134 TaxID=3400425 RepID=UPI003AAF3C1A